MAARAELPTRWRLAGRYAVLATVAVLVAFPIYVTVVGAFKPGDAFLNFPESLYPTDLTLATIRQAWDVGNLQRYLVNSTIVAVSITVGQVVTSILAAYVFAFLRFPGQRVAFLLFLATLMVPGEVTVLANAKTIGDWGWVNSYQALIVPFLATALGTFLLRQVFLTVPDDLREAAAMDGVGHWRFLWGVAVPLARPTIGALALFSFLGAWNQYLWPQRVTTDTAQYGTVQIGLKSLRSAAVDELNLVMAGTLIAAIPIFVILILFQRQLIRGLTAGAVKG